MTQEVTQLVDLMKRHELTRAAVARLCGVHEVTVDSWLTPEGKALHRKMHKRHLVMLRLGLGQTPSAIIAAREIRRSAAAS